MKESKYAIDNYNMINFKGIIELRSPDNVIYITTKDLLNLLSFMMYFCKE